MNNYLIERALVTIVCKMIKDGHLAPAIRNHAEFANLAFPQHNNNGEFWKAIRIGKGGRPPQPLLLIEAMAIADAIKIPLPMLYMRAQILVESGFTLADDPVNNKEQSKKKGKGMPKPENSSVITQPTQTQD